MADIIGKNVIGGTNATVSRTARGTKAPPQQYTASAGDSVQEFFVYGTSGFLDITIEAAIYTAPIAVPVTRLHTAIIITVTPGPKAWHSASAPTPISLIAGLKYTFAFSTPNGDLSTNSDFTAGGSSVQNIQNLPPTWTELVTDVQTYSAYAPVTHAPPAPQIIHPCCAQLIQL